MYSKVLFEQIPDDAEEPGGRGKGGRTKKTSPPTSPTSSTTSSKRANSNSPRKGGKNNKGSPSASGKKKPMSPRSSAGDNMIAEKLDGTLNPNTTRELAAAQSTSSRGRGLSFRSSGNKNNSSSSAKSGGSKNNKSPRSPSNRLGASMDVLDTAAPPGDEDDPVMVLFQSRNTQKVRFSLGDTVPKERGGGGGNGNSNNTGGALERRDSSGRLMKLSGGGGGGGDSPRASFNIKKFMKGALFGSSNNETKAEIKGAQSEEYEFELTKEVEAVKKQNNEISWSTADRPEGAAGADDGMLAGAEALSPSSSVGGGGGDGFPEDRETRATVIKLLNKARRAQFLHYRYPYAVKCYVRSLELLKEAQYPDDHPTVVKTIKLLQAAHFANSSFTNSANIVKLGIKYEDTGELVRALKMYTIAYRIRRDNLSGSHPSLVVLLNMLGSIQIKRGELEEAMQIFKLALKDTTTVKNCPNSSSGDESTQSPPPPSPVNYLTRAVTYREMGCVHEEWGEIEMAHNMYHASLECMAEYKGIVFQKPAFVVQHGDGNSIEEKKLGEEALILHDLEETRLAVNDEANDHEDEGEEVPFLAAGKKSRKKWHSAAEGTTHTTSTPSRYDVFFPASLEEKKSKKRLGKKHQEKTEEKRGDHTDVDVALTIHRIAQLHRTQQEYQLALPAFYVSLRGMKYALGKSHPNVAAILGNIGNLLK